MCTLSASMVVLKYLEEFESLYLIKHVFDLPSFNYFFFFNINLMSYHLEGLVLEEAF